MNRPEEVGPLGPRAAGALESPNHGWTSRGYLPHFDAADIWQFITHRLADALPADAIARLIAEVEMLPESERTVEQRRRIDTWIDVGHGACLLARDAVAALIRENWKHFAGERYDLGAWVIMPNHVHLLIRVAEDWPLERIVRSWKSYSAKRMMQATGCAAPVWNRDYWDRFIRDEGHWQATVDYIERNPVKAGLVTTTAAWRWSSAFERAGGARSQGAAC